MSFRKSSFFQDPMTATGSFTGSFSGTFDGIVSGNDVLGAVVLADSATLALGITGSDVVGAVVQADSASLAAGITGSNVVGTVDSASVAQTASFLIGFNESASFASTASFGNPTLFTSPRPIITIQNNHTYSVIATDHTVLIDASSGTLPFDVLLPDIAAFIGTNTGKVLSIIKSSGSNNVRILASASQDIAGDATSTLVDRFQGLTLQPSGITWWVI